MKPIKTTSLLTGLLLCSSVVVAQESSPKHGHMHGGNHDTVNMPGLRGKNATPEESAEIATLFRNFRKISRSVENLPDGIRTVTRSDDTAVMNVLISHTTKMIDRVKERDDPEILIQSPTLDVFFLLGDQIESTVSVTDEGLIVVQTSNNPEVVSALQTHAAEVTDMVDQGMHAVHQMMMKQGRSH